MELMIEEEEEEEKEKEKEKEKKNKRDAIERMCTNVNSSSIETNHRNFESFSFITEEICNRNFTVFKNHCPSRLRIPSQL
jgi:hypothetical protein